MAANILKSVLLGGLLTFGFAQAHAGEYESAKACLVVYVKVASDEPNLTIACDGVRLATDTVAIESQLPDPAAFKAGLMANFVKMVNETGAKTCNIYEVDTTWWANCSR